MRTSESYHIWLETAYRFFAEKGPENLSIKELAKLCKLPRTNFYYHFENKNELIDKIISLHFQTTVEIFSIELNKRLHTFIPDLYSTIYDFRLGLKFAKTLFKHRDNPKFNYAHMKGVDLTTGLIVPKFKEYFKINLPDEEVKEIWVTLTDTWYSRLNFESFSVNYMCDLCLEIMDTILPLIKKNNQITDNPHFYSTPLSK